MSYQDTCERLRDEQQMLRWSILAEDQEESLDDVEEDDYNTCTVLTNSPHTDITEYIDLE